MRGSNRRFPLPLSLEQPKVCAAGRVRNDRLFGRRVRQSGLLQVESPAQSLYAALGIYNALLPRVKGVAFAADLHAHGGLGRAGVENVTAGASYHRVDEFGMNISFHDLLC